MHYVGKLKPKPLGSSVKCQDMQRMIRTGQLN